MLRRKYRQGAKGGAMIELILALPLLLLLTIGIIELGTIFFTWNALNKSVRDGTRFLTDPNVSVRSGNNVTTTPTNRQRAINLVKYGKFNPIIGTDPLVVNFTNANNPQFVVNNPVFRDFLGGDGTPDHVVVSATYIHPLIVADTLNGIMGFFGGDFNSGNITISLPATVVMRIR